MIIAGLVADEPSIASIQPRELVAYLRSHGWEAIDGALGTTSSSTWVHGEASVLVPHRTTWSDYTRRVASTIGTLAEVERRQPDRIARDVAEVFADVVRVTEVGMATADGTVPLDDALILVQGVKQSLLAAACSAVKATRILSKRRPVLAMDFAESLRLGQTERGSFIVRVLSVLPDADEGPKQLTMFELASPPKPFGRQATEMFARAASRVVASAAAAAKSGSFELFERDEAVDDGVSAEFCDAIGLLAGCSIDANVSVDIAWTRTRPIPTVAPVAPLVLSREIVEVARAAGKHLRERQPEPDFRVIGTVVALDRPADQLQGSATVHASVGGRMRKLSIELWGPDWKTAAEALENRVLFTCAGVLVRDGRQFRVESAAKVGLVVEDEEDDEPPTTDPPLVREPGSLEIEEPKEKG